MPPIERRPRQSRTEGRLEENRGQTGQTGLTPIFVPPSDFDVVVPIEPGVIRSATGFQATRLELQ